MVDSTAATAAANQAVTGLVTALQDISSELANAQGQLQYWRVEAEAWKARYEQEKARNVRLRRVLRATPAGGPLSAQPSLASCASLARRSLSGLSATSAAAAFSSCADLNGSSGAGDGLSLQQRHLRPLKCVTEEAGSAGGGAAGQHGMHAAGAASQQPGSAHARLAAQSGVSSSAESTPVSATAPAAGPERSGSSMHDPFARVQMVHLGTVSDPGEVAAAAAAGMAQQQQQQTSALGGSCDVRAATAAVGATAAAAASSPSAAVAAAGGTAAAPMDGSSAETSSGAGFRRSRTLPVSSSFSFVRSPRCPAAAASSGGGSFLQPAGTWLPPQGSRHTVDQLLRVMMAFTLMQGTAGDADEQHDADTVADEEALPSVSLDDDDGSSGVGLAAAAAVSAAMARAWASAASREQRAVAAAAGSSGAVKGGSKGDGGSGGGAGSGRAGFRLVATVTNKMGKRPPSTTALSAYASQDSLDSSSADLSGLATAKADGSSTSQGRDKDSGRPGSSSGSGGLSRLGSPSPIASAAAAAAAASGGLPPLSPGGVAPAVGSGSPAQRSVAAAVPAAGGAPNTGQATTISLQWLSRPRTVLVMRKLAPTTESAFLRALDWLKRHNVTIFVEPKVFDELVASGRVLPVSDQQQQQQQQFNGSNSSSSLVTSRGSGGLSGVLISTAQQAPSAAPGALAPAVSWPGPTRSSGGGTGGGSSADRPPAAAAAGGSGGGAALAANIRTWQPELLISQQQQQQQLSASDCGCQFAASDLIPESVAQLLDLVVVLGGDGTVLWTCHIFGNRSVPPLVPFNLGSLGFLTPFDPARLEQVLHKTFRGGFPITLRHRLHCTIVRCGSNGSSSSIGGAASQQQPQQLAITDGSSGLPSVVPGCTGGCLYGEEHVSLNEVVIERGISPFLTNLECFCDGTFVTHVQGDGLIVGTPTGSTAYSLAAGGSMVHPQVPCILFTPICPHSLSFRPLMFPDYVQLCVQVPADARGHVWASFDGKDRTELCPGDAVVMRLSKWPVPSVAAEDDPSSDWFSAVRECLHWNIRKVQGGAGM